MKHLLRYLLYMRKNKTTPKQLAERITDVLVNILANILSLYFRITGKKEL